VQRTVIWAVRFFACGVFLAGTENGEYGKTPGGSADRKIFHKGISLYALLISKA